MTERTIRHTAKRIAGEYYEGQRTARFRRENPDQIAYVNCMWPHFVDLAIRGMVETLKDQTVPEHLKEAIVEALKEQAIKGTGGSAALVPQATLEPVEREDRKLIEDNPQLLSSHNT